MSKKFLVGVLSLLIFTGINYGQKETLTLRQCIDLALSRNPQIKIAEGNYELSASSLVGTRSSLFPQISFQTGWTRNGGTTFIGPIQREGFYNNFSYGFQVQQLVFDFGKSYTKVAASADFKNASEQNFISTKQDLILATDIAYFNYLQSKRLIDVINETVKQAQEHLRQAKAFYSVGTSPRFDVLKAETDLANAKVNLISAENNIRISRLQLGNILNQTLPDSIFLEDNLEVKNDSVDIKSAVENAMNNRPEIISSKYKMNAGKSLLTSAWLANLPSINATGGYNWRSYSIDQQFPNSWNVGVTLSLPLFQGFALDAGIEQARANLKTTEAANEALVQSIILDVQQQYSTLQEANERIAATRALVSQADETLKLAEGRYKQGVGSAIEITDALVGYYNAETSYIQSLYDYHVSYARLQRAMGILK
ncbi:MAG TPA: TolC family protein [Ignavibacteriaceae bacterium]|nr:TolC family protein [Ignavibacteriaceae bacterium]